MTSISNTENRSLHSCLSLVLQARISPNGLNGTLRKYILMTFSKMNVLYSVDMCYLPGI